MRPIGNKSERFHYEIWIVYEDGSNELLAEQLNEKEAFGLLNEWRKNDPDGIYQVLTFKETTERMQ